MESERVSKRLPTRIGLVSRRCISASSFAYGSPDCAHSHGGEAVFRATQSARKACRFFSKLTTWANTRALNEIAGPTTASKESARTWVGRRCAYIWPRYVPEENPKEGGLASPGAMRIKHISRAALAWSGNG